MVWIKILHYTGIAIIFSIGCIAGHFQGVAKTLNDNIINKEKVFCVRQLGSDLKEGK